MSEQTESYLKNCLYFTANSLARAITRVAEQEFSRLGLSPSHAFLLMLVVEKPGITQKELAEHLHLAPSTVSRFADLLVQRGLVEKRVSGKLAQVFPTAFGKEQLPVIQEAWKALYERYSAILGKEEGEALTQLCHNAAQKIGKE